MYLPINDLDELKTSEAHYIPIQYKNDIYLVHDLKDKNDLMLFGDLLRFLKNHKPSDEKPILCLLVGFMFLTFWAVFFNRFVALFFYAHLTQ